MSECPYCVNSFEMNDTCADEFRMWQGLVGPYYIPSVDELGNLTWTNTGELPNPDPINIAGTGINIVGIVDAVGDLPPSAQDFDAYLVGEDDPYNAYIFDGTSWVDLGPVGRGPQGPQGPAGPQVDPATALPLMDGAAAVGVSAKYAREDHVHPQDSDIDDLKTSILQATEQTITASTTGTSAWITLTGLTADHVVGNWGLRDSNGAIPENAPPCDIEIETDTNRWRYTLTNNSTAFYLKPTFIKD